MAVKKEDNTFFILKNEILQHQFRPIYVLYGEEPYYMDQLSELIVQNALTEDERDFNLSIYYGNDALVPDVIDTCKQYPAFSQHKVVVLREAQLITKVPGHKNDLNLFQHYAERPLESTILVICYKGEKMSAKPFFDNLRKHKTGVIFESNRLKNDSELAKLVVEYCAAMPVKIDSKSVAMLLEFIGNDISRMFGELDKLRILVGENEQGITPDLIEKNIGISKDYNNFELEDALRTRNVAKAFRIIDYFEKNPKNNPLQVTLAMLFTFFSSILIVRAAKDKSPSALMEATGTKSQWRVRKFEEAARNYSTNACVYIISYLRECDVKSKGMGSRQEQYALLRELIYKILHA